MFTAMLNRVRRSARSVAILGGLAALVTTAIIPLAGFTSHASANLCAPTDVTCVIHYGDLAIAARQVSLTTLNSHVNTQFKAGRITSSDNATLTGDIAANESGLAALKTKLDSDTDATTARADVKSIYTTYRIYLVVLPRDYHELWLDMAVHTDNRLTSNETLIQDAINGAPAGVQQQANQLFNDYKTQVTNARAQTSAAQQIIPQLTPSAFNSDPTGYKTTFTTYRTDVRSAHTDTRAAISDLHQIVVLLKGASA